MGQRPSNRYEKKKESGDDAVHILLQMVMADPNGILLRENRKAAGGSWLMALIRHIEEACDVRLEGKANQLRQVGVAYQVGRRCQRGINAAVVARAAAGSRGIWTPSVGSSGLNKAPTRARLGTASLKKSSLLPNKCVVNEIRRNSRSRRHHMEKAANGTQVDQGVTYKAQQSQKARWRERKRQQQRKRPKQNRQ